MKYIKKYFESLSNNDYYKKITRGEFDMFFDNQDNGIIKPLSFDNQEINYIRSLLIGYQLINHTIRNTKDYLVTAKFKDKYIQLSKSDDEYYYVMIEIFSIQNTYSFYICDQLEGIKQLLIDKEFI